MTLVATHKTCSICREHKPLDGFPVNKQGRLGRQGRCTPCDKAYTKKWRKANPVRHAEVVRRAVLKRNYGITPDDYEKMLAAQGGVCAICEKEDPDGRRLAVDHDHDTDEVRGLLCRPCNTALGLLGDDERLVIRALQYIGRSLN